jgi:hypothetical protein
MDPMALALSMLVWHGSTDIATGGGERGPWRMNESRYEYVDDPTVSIGARGDILVAWVDQAQKDVFFRRYSADGKASGPALNVSRSPKVLSWLPRVASDANGTVFVLWQEIIFSGGSHGGDILFARSHDGGASFSAPLNLSDSRAGDGKGRITPLLWHNGSLDLAVADNVVYTAWTEYEGALWVRKSADGGRTFSEKVKLEDSKPARAPSLAAQGTNVYLAWTVGDDQAADIRVAKSTDGARTFSAPVIVARSKPYSDAPKLALDARGTLHLVYGEGDRVLYTRSADGARFERPRDISGDGAGFPSLALDAAGRICVLWERFGDDGPRPRGLGIAVSRDGGKTFQKSEIPGSSGDGANGGLQGLLMRKLAVSPEGQVAVVNSSFQEKRASRVWLLRGALK